MDQRLHEARLNAIQQEAAHKQAASEEWFVGLLVCVTQPMNTQLQQLEQGMLVMFRIVF